MKYNLEREFEIITQHIRDAKDKLGELTKRISNMEQIQQYHLTDSGMPMMFNATGHSLPNSNNST